MLSLIASVVLGGVMCIAGASKIAMSNRWPAEAASMRAPRFVIPFVPWIEIASGALLVAQWQREVVGTAVAVLLIAFTVLIVVNLVDGNRPSCACFGTWSARPLGWSHIARNVGLILLAGLIWT